MAAPQKLVLIHRRAPGDTTVLTALVRDLALTYPGRFQIDVDTSAMSLWDNNPYLTRFYNPKQKKQPSDIRLIKCQYGRGIRDQNHETVHFLAYFHRDFERQTRIRVPVTFPTPDLHLSAEERQNSPVQGRYWAFLSGGKSDFTAKVWDHRAWAKTTGMLRDYGIPLVQLGALDKGHWHPEIPGVLNMVGKTNLRDMLRFLYHAEGVICGVTFAMHASAALQKPCVVIAGGREAWWWEAYVNENKGFGPQASGKVPVPHKFLHTIGLLDCCQHAGCWRNKVLPLHNDKLLCKKPVVMPGQSVPRCMDLITPEHVVEAVMSYTDRSLAPIKHPNQIVLPGSPTAPVVVATPRQVVQPQTHKFLDLFDDGVPARIEPLATAAQVSLPAAPVPQLNTAVKLSGQPQPKAVLPGRQQDTALLDHPAIGGKYTAFVLLYGPSGLHDLHRRCLQGLISTVPDGRMDLRIGSNELCAESVQLVEELRQQGIVSKHYQHLGNDKKYPVMREMFWDESHPITTPWILWFDDDSIVANPNWLTELTRVIVQNQPNNCHMVGGKYLWTLQKGQGDWYRKRPWYRHKPFRDQSGRAAPNGNKVHFITGGFWALSTEAMRACNLPDVALGHNGGDVLFGEALYQNGYGIKAWNGQKQFINTSSVPRRGLSEKHPGT